MGQSIANASMMPTEVHMMATEPHRSQHKDVILYYDVYTQETQGSTMIVMSYAFELDHVGVTGPPYDANPSVDLQ